MKKPSWLKCHKNGRGKVLKPPVIGVYMITAPGGEAYVGSGNCYDRWADHGSKLRRHKHHSPNLQAVADFYGEANLVFEVIEELPQEVLLEAEQCLIDHLRAEEQHVLNQALASGGGHIARNTCSNNPPKRVRGTHLKTGHVIEFPSCSEARRCGFHQGNVSAACRGVLNTHNKHGGTDVYRGYRWEYVA